MDFIVDLPKTKRGNTAVLVFVDRLSKMVHFAATTKDVGAEDCARLYVEEVWRLHGLQDEFVSDRDSRFTSKFWREVLRLIGTKQAMSTAFHPQSDGQTERVNRILEDFLRHFVSPSQDNWDALLPMAEFAVNNAYQESIKTTPFFLNYGQHPLNPLQPKSKEDDNIDVPLKWSRRKKRSSLGQLPAAEAFAREMSEALQRARAALKAAQDRQKAHADNKRSDLAFNQGDQVLLSTVNLKLKARGIRKLWPKFIGPFQVIRQIGKVAYELALPTNMKVHPIFHVSLLKAWKSDGRVQPPPPPVEIEGEPTYLVEQILYHRDVKKGRGSKREYLVKWLGYGVEHNTWEPEGNLTICPGLVETYWESKAASEQVRASAKGSKRINAPRSNQ